MALLDWIFVIFGAAVALTGGWIQLHPERVVPSQTGKLQSTGWRLDPTALNQIRMLGACFLFMGAFFALQMTIDLTRLPWWIGAMSGLFTAISAVSLVNLQFRRQQSKDRRSIQQSALPRKVLELR